MKQIVRFVMFAAAAHALLIAQPRISDTHMSRIRRGQNIHLTEGLEGFADGSQAEARFQASARLAGARRDAQPQVLPGAPPATDRLIPLMLNGTYNQSLILTLIRIYNVTDTPAEVYLDFYDDYGYRTSVPFLQDDGTLDGSYQSASGVIAARGLGHLATYPLLNRVRTTYGRVRSVPSNALEITVSTAKIDGDRYFESGWCSPKADAQRFVYLNYSFDTHLTAWNSAGSASTITISARSLDGREQCQMTRGVPAGQVLSLDLPANNCFAMLGDSYLLEVGSSEPGLGAGLFGLSSDRIFVGDTILSRN